MAEQFQLILIGMFIGSAIVWFLTRRKVKDIEAELRHVEKEKAEEEQIASGLEGFNEKMQKVKGERKEKILQMFETKAKVSNDDVEELLDVSHATSFRYLEELQQEGKIKQVGKTGRNVHYKRKQ
ncbi:DeoR family transcriptional regulator [Patescibacteria group bacterium]|nr:DeoR family transcriptional regulator [Patescibacteria group bacterium]